MHDPHVQAMYYRVCSGEGVSYLNPEPMSFSNHLGTFDLSDGKLRIVPSEHFPDERSSRQAIEPFLEDWKIEAHLARNVEMLRFQFERVDLVDRAPPPLPPISEGQRQNNSQAKVLNLSAAGYAVAFSSASLELTCHKYPQPPGAFRATTEVQYAYRRWIEYRSGREPLQAMAYFMLTLLENAACTQKCARKEAARVFQIDEKVLDKIGELSSERGDEKTARKAPRPGKELQELTSAEKQWLEKTIPLVIRRLGERAYGASLALISCDLPNL